jgi:hypothetical protein
MVKLLGTMAGLVGVFWMALAGGYGVYWYDRRPAGVPAPYTLHILFFSKAIGLPTSLQAQLDAANDKLKTEAAADQARQAKAQAAYARVSAKARAAEAKAQAAIRAQTSALQQEIPHVLTSEIDARYPLPVGLVRVHDAAALGLPLTAGQPDGAPSPVEASRLGETIASNYGECRADQERLIALQAWVVAARRAAPH